MPHQSSLQAAEKIDPRLRPSDVSEADFKKFFERNNVFKKLWKSIQMILETSSFYM